MQTVRQLLAAKAGGKLVYVAPQVSVLQALRVMAEENVGAVLVMGEGHVEGIFSERDYARRIILEGRSSASTQVSEVMTSKVICVGPDQRLDECMALMTDKRIRHLPVIDGGEVEGVISIGDVVRATIAEQQFVIEQLVHYINNVPPQAA
ncbi:CBS domain-containing protein [Crenobacter caeni]|uniref:CBS domain-containing protein n=1 Tax=Crenobacter caeni TaxID=2705474 RepID=A0A6B2KPP6_9NEIS|nr:CBS domain-containing protein [Crenobacter caeni]NDV11939.1 CBS domain-containing protein [Crenobacter caeni]